MSNIEDGAKETEAQCPNCGTAWPSGAAVCPHCGALRPGNASWPPPPVGLMETQLPPMPPSAPSLITGRAWGDITLGVGLTFVSFFLYCLGVIVMPILYFTLRAQYPAFARGIGYGLLGGIVLALGALALCFSSLAGTH